MSTATEPERAPAHDSQLEVTRSIIAKIDKLISDADSELPHTELEALVASLGLFPREEEFLRHFPESLHEFCGKGIGMWQYPNQIVPLLVLLSRYEINSYLEIGVAAGGTFTLLSELLSSWCAAENFRAVACDPAPPGRVSYLLDAKYEKHFKEWLQDTRYVSFVQEFSERLERRYAGEPLRFDCVFIDGDHSFEGCWADCEMALRMEANIIIFHDIVNSECPGVCEAWCKAQEQLAQDFRFFEFVEQYESVQKKVGSPLLGIGACVRKTTPPRRN